MRSTPACHPDRKYYAKDMCRNCYATHYSKTNRDKINALKRAEHLANPALKRACDARYYEKNGVTIKRKMNNRRLEAIAYLGGRCVVCGWTDVRALCIDHVNGDGAADRRNGGNGAVYIRALTDTTGKYQVLCSNHNAIKMYERNEFARPIKKVV